MFEDINFHRAAVADHIAKSFINDFSSEDTFEKGKWNVGDTKVYQGVTWEVGGFNAKGTPLWRKKKDQSGSGGASAANNSRQSQVQSKTSSEGNVTIGMSPGEEEDAYARAHKQNIRDYANAPQKLKARNEKMVFELERLGNKINNEIVAKIKEKSPHYRGSGDFEGISTGSLFFNHVPKEGEFEFNIHTRCYVEKDADNFVEKLHSSIQKVAKDNGFKFIKIDRASGATGEYKKVKVAFKKELSDFNKKHEKNSWEEIK